tara:strand:+ start:499 stop:1023 length:525 start_codon:yes stop_codon:yes gene_type:complete
MWESILKSKSPQGIQVTKMYMFLKRYFAEVRTEQFNKTYITWEEFRPYDRAALMDVVERIVAGEHRWGSQNKTDMPIPGISLPIPRTYNNQSDKERPPDITFNDADHTNGRKEHIKNASPDLDYRRSVRYEKPYDVKLQGDWQELERIIKRTGNYDRTYRYENYLERKKIGDVK